MNYVLVIKRICTEPDDEANLQFDLARREEAGSSPVEALHFATQAALILARKGWAVWRDQDGWWAEREGITIDLWLEESSYVN